MWLPPVLVGIALRFWSLFFGLPNLFRPDEDMVVLPSLGMVGGDLDPHDYTYPTLYKYILAFVFRACMLLGWGAQGAVTGWETAAYGYFVDGTFFFQAETGGARGAWGVRAASGAGAVGAMTLAMTSAVEEGGATAMASGVSNNLTAAAKAQAWCGLAASSFPGTPCWSVPSAAQIMKAASPSCAWPGIQPIGTKARSSSAASRMWRKAAFMSALSTLFPAAARGAMSQSGRNPPANAR